MIIPAKAKNFVRKETIKKIVEYRKWASENWVRYTLLRSLFFLFVFPMAVIEIGFSTAPNYSLPTLQLLSPNVRLISYFLGLALFALPIALMGVFFLIDPARLRVLRNKPEEFLKAEKIEHFFSNFLFPVVVAGLFIVIVLLVLAVNTSSVQFIITVLYLQLFLVFAGNGLLFNIYIQVFESPDTIEILIKILRRSSKTKFLSKPMSSSLASQPTLIMQAKTRFIVVSGVLTNNPTRKKIKRKFRLFLDGIVLYSKYLKQEFGFVLNEPKRFYSLAKLSCYSKDKVSKIASDLNSLIKNVKEEEEPFEAIKYLKSMVNESTSFESICSEIEVDPSFIEKKLISHSGLIGLIAIIVSPVLFVISLVLFFSGIIPNPF